MIKIKIIPDDGDAYEITATSRDITQWEKRNKSASLKVLVETPRLNDYYVIAHISATRQGLWAGSEAEFRESCDIDILGDEDSEPDPTPPAA